ncbi:beta-defensin 113 [Diceros bicornis minor]|uniref:beta-defensin 113 n=1 Tax=Diceros bicornis minor TaxID=77932 RepID=UPI0026F320B6|nr:beta-defensin 113 [Diceros bicornis minor]
MKILCIFLTFVFTVSCGPSVSQKTTKEIAERKRECYLVRGACKTSCNTWEYIYNYCHIEPCCVVREYQKPTSRHNSTTTSTDVTYNSTTLHNSKL